MCSSDLNVIDEHPVDAAIGWAREQLGPKSASSLRFAVRAVRMAMTDRVRALLPAMERGRLRMIGELLPAQLAPEGMAIVLTAWLETATESWDERIASWLFGSKE